VQAEGVSSSGALGISNMQTLQNAAELLVAYISPIKCAQTKRRIIKNLHLA
jgi:hypothetical protein